MPISFLDLVPKQPSAIVTVEGEQGPAEVEVAAITLMQLAEIGRRYPAFSRVVEGGAGILSAMEAMPAIVAAGTGHHGDAECERKAASMPSSVIIALASQIITLTFPRPTQPAEVEVPPAEEVVRDILPGRTSPLRLSS